MIVASIIISAVAIVTSVLSAVMATLNRKRRCGL